TDSFKLGSVACNSFKLSVNKAMVANHPTDVKIEDDNTTFYLVVDSFTEDRYVYNYTLVDKLINFNFNYDASGIINAKHENEEVCYLSDIWHDMCVQAGVEYDDEYEFINDIEVEWYDNTIQARKYLSYIAELQGGYAIILPNGKQSFKPYKKDSIKEIDIDECSDFILGEKKTITRVVYDNGVVKWEFGDDNGTTLYLDSTNTFITSEEIVENIYDLIVDFEFYLLNVPNAPMDSSVRAGDIITFADDFNEYPTIAQYSMSYGGQWVGGYSLQIKTDKQEETKLIGKNEIIKKIESEFDRTNAELKITAEQTEGNTKQITEMNQTVNGIKTTITENTENFENKMTIFEQNIDGLKITTEKSGNNLFSNTMFFDFNDWSMLPNFEIYEAPIPPTGIGNYFLWYCTQDFDIYKAGVIYQYIDGIWEETDWKKSTFYDDMEDGLKQYLQIVENQETETNYASGRKVQFNVDGTGQQGGISYPLVTKIIPINQDEEFMTLSYKIKNNLEYGKIDVYLSLLYDNVADSLVNENEIFTIGKFYADNDARNLSLEKIKIYNQNQKRLVYGNASQIEPEDTEKLWLKLEEDDSFGQLHKYNHETEQWEVYDDQIGFVDITTDILYSRTSYDSRFWTFGINKNNYVTKYAYFEIDIRIIYVDQSETEPEPYKDRYWGNPVTNEIKRPIFDGDTFVGWELLDVTNDVALENDEYSPFLYPKGTVDFGDLKLEYGDYTAWSSNQNEIFGRNGYFGSRGLEITKDNNKMFIDEDEIKATYKDTTVFNINQDEIYGKKIRTEEFELNSVVEKQINTGTRKITIRYEV
ncbi:MAG TPA: hypothetical protein GX708_14940, partial [Gallicola sp.]|nr:hypothetical protein [Gallicola sp.]